ncbi:hypothetical protein GTP55_27745 [Duganella sp. FT109W]|uniref:Uncharacterized protein n=1 Tax=Duganella margarita TaxID=2692170 RepID=A0ABW9WRY4_9BURK|nr:hypothetical protein [Duganella margarita]MYN43143.1 hypothetical protein [Duganella margarita]
MCHYHPTHDRQVMSCRLLGMVIELALLPEVIAVLLEAKPAMVVSGLVRKADKNTSAQGCLRPPAGSPGITRNSSCVLPRRPLLAPHAPATCV